MTRTAAKTDRPPPPVREGDTVRIVKPVFVTRVGYPKQVKDYLTPEGIRVAPAVTLLRELI